MKCPVCQKTGDLDYRVLVECGHVFCNTCVQTVLDTNPVCPTCRRGFEDTDAIKVYLPTENEDEIVDIVDKCADGEFDWDAIAREPVMIKAFSNAFFMPVDDYICMSVVVAKNDRNRFVDMWKDIRNRFTIDGPAYQKIGRGVLYLSEKRHTWVPEVFQDDADVELVMKATCQHVLFEAAHSDPADIAKAERGAKRFWIKLSPEIQHLKTALDSMWDVSDMLTAYLSSEISRVIRRRLNTPAAPTMDLGTDSE